MELRDKQGDWAILLEGKKRGDKGGHGFPGGWKRGRTSSPEPAERFMARTGRQRKKT